MGSTLFDATVDAARSGERVKRARSLPKKDAPAQQASPSTKGRSFQQREVQPERESCGEVQFWYCPECNTSKVVQHGSAESDFETHMTLHRVRRMKFTGGFGPRLVLVKGKVSG